MESRKIAVGRIADDVPVIAGDARPGHVPDTARSSPIDRDPVPETAPHRRAAHSPTRPAGPAAAESGRRRSRLPPGRPPRPPRSELGVPVAFGYVRVPPSWPSVVSAERVRTLEAVAHRCGWVLGETFVDDEPDRPLLAYRHLRAATLAAVRDDSAPVAVMVVSGTEFADAAEQADALRADLERVTGVPVVISSALRLPDDDPQVQGHPPGWDELIAADEPRTGQTGPGGVDPAPRRAR